MTENLEICVLGKRFHVAPRRRSFWQKVTDATWEPETFEIFEFFINKQTSYIDIGSWIGPTLLFGCQLAKSAYGIEPNPIAYAELAENLALNEPITDNVKIFNICITQRSGQVVLGSRGGGGDSMSSLLFSNEETRWKVDGVNFEEFLKENNIDGCTFIKMDIEGGEYSVLPVMYNYIQKYKPTLYISLHPHFLASNVQAGVPAPLERFSARFAGSLSIIRVLSLYNNIYSTDGEKLNMQETAFVCYNAHFPALVATDLEWHAAKRAKGDHFLASNSSP